MCYLDRTFLMLLTSCAWPLAGAPGVPYTYTVNARQTRFVQEYLIDRNGAAAAVRAGYSPRTARQIAYELLTVPDIAAAVRAGEAQIAREAEISRRKVLEGLQEAIELARAKRDAGGMIAGWREIAKLCGYYAPERLELQLSAGAAALQHELEYMSDAELAKLVAQGDEPSTEPPLASLARPGAVSLAM